MILSAGSEWNQSDFDDKKEIENEHENKSNDSCKCSEISRIYM